MEKLLAGRKVLVLAEDLYEEMELWYPFLRLREEGAEVTIAGTEAQSYRGKHGYPVTVDIGIDRVSAGELDALIIPGGFAPDRLRHNDRVLALVREMLQQGKPVAAICHAAWVLISAGVIAGRRATCAAAIRDDVVNAGADYVDAEVVRDGNMITSRGPQDLGVFCREIIEALQEAPTQMPEPTVEAPQTVEAVVEIPKGSRNKYELEHKSGAVHLDRVLFSSVHYPTDYGFIPHTRSADGDPLDVLILMEEPTFPGCRVKVRPIGVLVMRDEKGTDEKILAVPIADPRFESIDDISRVQKHWLVEIENFFATYKMLEGKETVVEGWRDANEARAVLKRSLLH